ncbi:hypothetical protein LX64_02304 [Chitinophaga skermanii]|uniref:DoxX-like protein n=1 Tax=Chitinophaga skermanii TaxID=331697 RepID=A0A327QLG9_9BACT|nr:hypothetical protein [Chitinophaga skermanii]RAJ05150.1 hypothetical protein LX64_02304 [Chitinophaga skermanii]
MPFINPRWTNLEKIAFRFFFIFICLNIFPFPLNAVSQSLAFLQPITGIVDTLWEQFIPWAAQHIWGYRKVISIFPNGSGDTTFNYYQILTQFSMALVGTLIWSMVDKERKSYNRAYYLLRWFTRFFLAFNMVLYGFIKVFHMQMPTPSLYTLLQPVGDKSPMGLAWTYVGASAAFSAVTGWAEVISGFLLFFRRTTTLGALLTSIVMFNVAVINFCFDVPVKIFSSLLFLWAMFLLAPDIKRLTAVLLTNRPTRPKVEVPFFKSRKAQLLALVAQLLFVAYIVISQVSADMGMMNIYGDKAPKPPLYGIYNTSLIVRNNDTLKPLTTDTSYWRQLVVNYKGYARVKMANDTLRYYTFKVDTALQRITIATGFAPNDSSYLYFSNDSTLTLRGKIQQDSVYMQFTKHDLNSFRLLNRGFHWVNEYPYNR